MSGATFGSGLTCCILQFLRELLYFYFNLILRRFGFVVVTLDFFLSCLVSALKMFFFFFFSI